MKDEAIDTIFAKAYQKKKESEVFVEYKPRGFTKHLNNAQKLGATTVALIGEDELANGTIWIKNLLTKEEKTIDMKDF